MVLIITGTTSAFRVIGFSAIVALANADALTTLNARIVGAVFAT